jgi:hypothetical protein
MKSIPLGRQLGPRSGRSTPRVRNATRYRRHQRRTTQPRGHVGGPDIHPADSGGGDQVELAGLSAARHQRGGCLREARVTGPFLYQMSTNTLFQRPRPPARTRSSTTSPRSTATPEWSWATDDDFFAGEQHLCADVQPSREPGFRSACCTIRWSREGGATYPSSPALRLERSELVAIHRGARQRWRAAERARPAGRHRGTPTPISASATTRRSAAIFNRLQGFPQAPRLGAFTAGSDPAPFRPLRRGSAVACYRARFLKFGGERRSPSDPLRPFSDPEVSMRTVRARPFPSPVLLAPPCAMPRGRRPRR